MIVRDRGEHAYSAKLNRALADRGDVQQALDIDAIHTDECYVWDSSHAVALFRRCAVGYETYVILNEVKNLIAVHRDVQRDGSLRSP
jgi:hypothetical protein